MKEPNVLLAFDVLKSSDIPTPEYLEGLVDPKYFFYADYKRWKDEPDPIDREIWMKSQYGESDWHIWNEIYDIISRNFTTAGDKEYMLYTQYLCTPKELNGIPQSTDLDYGFDVYEEEYQAPMYYPDLVNPMFGDEGNRIFYNFITIIRQLAVKNPTEVPKDLYEGLDLGNIESEFSIKYPLPDNIWKVLYKWEPIRGFIDAQRLNMPTTQKLVDIYGEPGDNIKFQKGTALGFDRKYVDLVPASIAELFLEEVKDRIDPKKVLNYALDN